MFAPSLPPRLDPPPIIRAMEIPARRDPRQNRRLSSGSKAAANVVTPGSYTNCTFWSRSDASTITLNAGNVSSWSDMSGHSRPFTQASALRQPLYVNNGSGINGLPYILFAGSTSNELRLTANGLVGNIPFVWMVLRPQWPGSGPGASLWYFLGNGNAAGAALATVASSVNSSTLQIDYVNTGATAGETAATLNEGTGYIVDWASDTVGTTNGGLVNNTTAFGDASTDATKFNGTPFNLGDCQTLTLCANVELYEIAGYSDFSNLATVRSGNKTYGLSYYGAGI